MGGCSASSHVVVDNPVNGVDPLSFNDQCDERPKTQEEEDRPISGEVTEGQVSLQNEETITGILASLGNGELWDDPSFPAEYCSIYYTKNQPYEIEWKRPCELVEKPEMYVGGSSRTDIKQGELGDCWFLSACAAVAIKPKLIQRVAPPDQVLHGDAHTGLIRCQFWRFGDWVNVYIDDRLPTRDGHIIYAHCTNENEFWVALLEKAYAKLNGTYEAIAGGQAMDALVDLTGGLAERYDLDPEKTKEIFKHMYKASKSGAFITCSRKGDWRMSTVADKNGLVQGHAYTVTKVVKVRHKTKGVVELVRVRNPWGNTTEWNGDWSDGSVLWDGVDEKTITKLDVTNKGDGEFWINVQDFFSEFQEVSICNLGPDYNDDGQVDTVAQAVTIRGSWVAGVNAGGSRNDFDSFATNPQFLLTVDEPDGTENPEDSGNESDGDNQSVIVSLLQEYRRSQRHKGVQMLQIALLVYETKEPSSPLPPYHFKYNYELVSSGTYINYREVFARLDVPPGHYVVIPATYRKDEEGTFMIRVFSTGPVRLSKLGK